MTIKRLLSSSFFLLIGNFIGRLSMFFANILAARVLAQDIFGQYMLIRSTISVVDAVANASIGNMAVKTLSNYSHEGKSSVLPIIKSVVLINLMLAVAFSAVLVLFGEYISKAFFLGGAEITFALQASGLLLLFALLASAAQKILIGIEGYNEVAVGGLITTVIAFPAIYWLTTSFGLLGAIFAATAYFFIDACVKYALVAKILKHWKVSLPNNVGILKSAILRDTAVLAFAAAITGASLWYLRVLSVEQSSGFNIVAAFDAAYQYLTVIMLVTGATTSVALQMLTKATPGNKSSKKQMFVLNMLTNVAIASTIAIIFSAFSRELMQLYGDGYAQQHALVYYVSAIGVLATISSLLDKLLMSSNLQLFILVTSVLGAATSLLFMSYAGVVEGAVKLACSSIVYYSTTTLAFLVVITVNWGSVFLPAEIDDSK